MDIERTMEFILNQQARFEANQAKFVANQAKFEANFAKADQRFLKAEKRLDRVDRVVAQLASASLRFRKQIRRSQIEADRQVKAIGAKLEETAEKRDETADKLNAPVNDTRFELVDASGALVTLTEHNTGIRRAELFHDAPGIALVPGARQHDHRPAAGRELVDQARRSQWIEQQQPLAVVDRVGRDLRAPALGVRRRPLGMRRLPVPQPRLQLPHGGMLNE